MTARKQKKKFKETGFGKFIKKFGNVIPDVIGVGAKVLTGDIAGALEDVKQALKGNDSPEAKEAFMELERMRHEFELEFAKIEIAEQVEVTKRWESDNLQELKFPKLIRPYSVAFSMLLIGFIVIAGIYDREMPTGYIAIVFPMLTSIVAAYFGLRQWGKNKR